MPPGDPFGYAQRRVVVTGCGSGIGAAAARLLSDAGAEVHGLDIRPGDSPVSAFTPVDLRDCAAIDRWTGQLTGPIDALFNCAGIAPGYPPLDVMTVNFIALRHLSERLVDSMAEGGAVVSVSSNGGMGWRERLPALQDLLATGSFAAAVQWCADNPEISADAYRLSKEAIVVWTFQQSASFIARGVRLNCTSPGTVQTPMLDFIAKSVPATAIDSVAQPIGRRSSPEEQAWVLLFLNSPLASYVNGADLPVDGGFQAARRLPG